MGTLNLFKLIYQHNQELIDQNILKWIVLFEDDVQLCPGTPEYILNLQNASDINYMHLSRGNVGTMVRPKFIPKYIELMKEAKDFMQLKKTKMGNRCCIATV